MSEGLGSGDPPAGVQLTTAEWGLWQAFRNGSEYDLRSGDPAVDDPSGDHRWGPERTIRARVIALLLLHGPVPLLGRVASLDFFVSVSLMPVSMALAGPVADAIGLRNTFFIAGLVPIVVAVVAVLWARLPADEIAHPLRD